MANRYKFQTVLEGFVSVGEDSGKFNNRTSAYAIPHETSPRSKPTAKSFKWAKSKATGRVQEAMTPWDDAGVVSTPTAKATLPCPSPSRSSWTLMASQSRRRSPVCPQGHQGEPHR